MSNIENMLSFKCRGRIRTLRVSNGLTVTGCTDGWIYVFGEDELFWSRKLSATYYRDPYTDVNVLSVDVNQGYVVAGTDFMDGKVYLFSLDGEMLWYKQFLCIVGCWERPEDIVAVAVGKNRVAVCTEWLNSFLHVVSMNGDILREKKVEGSIRDVAFWRGVAVGTSAALYIEDTKLKIPVSKIHAESYHWKIGSLIVSGADGVYAINGRTRQLYRAPEPLISVSKEFIAIATEDKLSLISKNGDGVWERKINQKPTAVFCDGERVYAGYRSNGKGCVEVVESGEVTGRVVLEGVPVHIGDIIVCIDDREFREIFFYDLL
jgi:outer membrane protein assembly factor BamB